MEQERVSFAERKYKAVWDCAADAMLFLDRDGVLDCNEAALRLLGLPGREAALGRPLGAFAPASQPNGAASAPFLDAQVAAALDIGHARFECQLRRADGSLLHADVRLHLIPIGGGRVAHGVLRDVTARWEAERRLGSVKDAMEACLHRLSYFDTVSGLPNRAQFLDRAELALRDAEAAERPMVMLSVGINDLKKINYSLGLEAGDAVLREMAGRIGDAVQARDLAARISGNEFGLLLDGCAPDNAAHIARRLVGAAAAPLRIGEHEVSVGISVGISVFGGDAGDLPTLMQHAEAAMYRARAAGGEPLCFYGESLSDAGLARLKLENSLRLALERQEFVLHYQPLLAASSGAIVGVEALVRWRHPERGLLPPAQFIPLAEQTGQIIPLGEWVLGEACRQGGAWLRQGLRPVEIAVNLAPRQFRKETLATTVARALEESGLPPERLVLELTEGALMENTERTLRILAELRAMGVRLAIDDFGTGYSSLAYLKRFPIQKLKVDQSFVRDLGKEEGDVVIAQAIVNLGHDLHLEVVAEGIETAEELAALRGYGCEFMQGFHFARAMPAADMERLLAQAHPA